MADVSKALNVVRKLNPMGFFSRATEEAQRLPQAKGTGEQMRAMLLKQGVKPDELKWTGFDEWAKGKKSVTRDEITEFLRRNEVQLGEKRLGANPEIAERVATRNSRLEAINKELDDISGLEIAAGRVPAQNPRWKELEKEYYSIVDTPFPEKLDPVFSQPQYSLPGGKDYSELLLKAIDPSGAQRAISQKYDAQIEALAKKQRELSEAAKKIYMERPQDGNDYARALDYSRDASGELRALTLQRDQEVAAARQMDRPYRSQHWEDDDNVLAHMRTKERTVGADPVTMADIERRMAGVTDAPSTSWGSGIAELAAARGAISPEEAATYSRSKGWHNKFKDAPGLEKRVLHLEELQSDWGKAARRNDFDAPRVPSGPFVESTPGWTNLALKRAMIEAARGNYDAIAWTPGKTQFDRYPGGTPEQEAKRLKGMIGYYDNILPTQIGKVLKDIDETPQFGTISLPVERQSSKQFIPSGPKLENAPQSYELPSLTITPAMREKINQGLPLFTMMPAAVGLGATASQMQEGQNPAVEGEGFADGGKIVRKALEAVRGLPKAVGLEEFMPAAGERRLPRAVGLEEFMRGAGERRLPSTPSIDEFMPVGGERRLPDAVGLEEFMPAAREPRLPEAVGLEEFMPIDRADGGKVVRKALEAIRGLPPAENSRLTQIATTGPSYEKALRHLQQAGVEGRAIDYGAGRGHGMRGIGADTFEPYPQGWTPTFTKPEDIPDDVYRRLVNLNVLNVLGPEARDAALLNMGRVVEPGGGGVISTRGRDVMSARGEPGPEPMSLIIGEGDQARYQKGFTPRELREYVGDTLGPRFDVEPSNVGAASIMFRRNRENGGPVDMRAGEMIGLRARLGLSPKKITDRAGPIHTDPAVAAARDAAAAEENPAVVEQALDVVRSQPRQPVAAPRSAPPEPSESQRLWQLYNESENPADFVRADEAMRAGRADGGVVRNGFAGGGKPVKSVIDRALAAIRGARPDQMRRAREQGFDTTKMYLHGTQTSPEEINPNFYISRDPVIADVYSRRGEELLPQGEIPEGAAVMPVLVKKGAAVPGRPGMGYFSVREPSDVRSIFAEFDPAKKDSSNIMSSIAAPAVLGAAAMPEEQPVERADGGRLLEDQYPTQYLPDVGRQVMQDGGAPEDFVSAQGRRRSTLEGLGGFEDRPVMDPAMMGQNWASAVQRFRERPLREGETVARPLELGGRDILGGAIAGDGGTVRGRIADMLVGSRGLPGSGTAGFGLADFTPAGVPLAVSDMSDALRNQDYVSAALSAAGPAVYYARKPIMAAGRAVYDAGRRAVDVAGDVLGRVPAPIAAAGAGAAAMTPEEAQAGKADMVRKALDAVRIATPDPAPRKMTLQEIRRTFDPEAGAGMSEDELARLVDAYGKVASPASLDPELAMRGREIAQSYITKSGSGFGGRSYFGQKPSTPLEGLGRVAEPIPYTHEPKPIVEKSWEEVGRERAGSPLISLGGDLSDLARLRAYGPAGDLRALARPSDIHAGFDYMREPNLHSVWSNNPEHAAQLEKKVLDQAVKKDLPVMAVANPMGPTSIDSAKNMMDLYLSAVEGGAIPSDALKLATKYIRSGAFGGSPKEKAKLQEVLAGFPGFEDIDKAREFLLNNPKIAGTTRGAIIKGMERKDWVKQGFPEVGQLRVAATSPKFMMAPGNVMGGRMVELDPRMFHKAEENRYFKHLTYGGDTPGTYYADVPLIHRQYGAPDVTDMLLAKYNQERPGATKSAPMKPAITVHPFSVDPRGRDTWRKMFEEQRMVQSINDRMMRSIQRGEQLRDMYGFKRGGSVSHRAMMIAKELGSSPRATV